jgi:predicted dehydrogenase
MNETLAVALLGFGYAGKIFHAPLIDSIPGLRLAAVGSSDPGKVHADWPEVAVVPDPSELMVRPDVDIVVIATPNDTHFDLARRALTAGKHVVVDKPFTVTSAEARELAALATRQGRVLSVFQNRRWDADFLTVRSLIASGALGEVMHFESHFDRYRPHVQARWRERAGGGNGLWYDLGSHLVDQVLQLFGPPLAVYADFAMQRNGAQAVDYFHVLLRYERRRVILHASVLVAGSSPRFAVHGSAGSYVKYGLDTQEATLADGGRPGGANWGLDPRDGSMTRPLREGVQTEVVATSPGDYRVYYTLLRDAIKSGQRPPVSVDDAIAVIALLELGEKSAAAHRELPVDEDFSVYPQK